MIQSKEDYLRYLEADKRSLGIRDKRPPLVNGDIWKFERLLRKCEYYLNCRYKPGSPLHRLYWKCLRTCYERRCVKLHFSIPLNVCGEGLALMHIGDIIINDKARLGRYCRIHAGVNIGTAAGERGKAPEIGDCCYFGPGAKLFGAIRVGNNVAVGANAVVLADVPDDVTVAGMPARVVSNRGTQNRERPLTLRP